MKSLALLVSASLLAIAGASAQEATETESRQDVVIVKGQKIDQALTDVAASVEVVTAEEIAREPVSDVYDIVERIPNVTTSFGDLGFAIRGIDQRGVGGSGRGQTLTVYVDDASLGNYTTFFGPLDSWDLGRVEVYRGPQSTNFGRNALAGAIYVRTQDPTYEPDFKARLEAGKYETYQVAAAGGGAIIEDKLAYRVSGQYRESDGFIENIYHDEAADPTEVTSGRLKLLFEPTEAISILSTTSYTENFAGEDGVPAVGAFDREANYDVLGREGTETFLQSINATWRISDQVELQSITAYQTTDYTRLEDYDVTPAPISSLDRVGEDQSISEELRLKYQGDKLQAVLGAYYTDASTDYTDSYSLPLSFVYPQLPVDNLVSREAYIKYGAENYAFFLDGEYDLSDTLSVLFGVRYDNETQTNDGVADTQILGTLPPLPPEILALLESQTGVIEEYSQTEYDAFLPKLGLRWAATPETTLAFVVQKAYRAGGSEISALDASLNYYEPEYLWNYEASSRSVFMDGRLRWNNNIYYADWTDQQVSMPVSPLTPNIYTTLNAGESTIYGFETDLSYQVSSAVSVYGAAGYAHTEFDEFLNFEGNSFPFAPEVTANIGFDYEGDGPVFGGLDISYQGSSYSDQENSPENENGERTLVNGRVGYKVSDNIRLSLIGRNLFDEDYYTFQNRDGLGGFSRIGDPRVVSIRLDADF